VKEYPQYRPVDPDAVDEVVTPTDTDDAFAEWDLSEIEHGSERDPGSDGAVRINPQGVTCVWHGRLRGWCTLTGAPRQSGGRHAFSVRVRDLPKDAVLRIGWTLDDGVAPHAGWGCYSDGGCFGGHCWQSASESWSLVDYPFRRGDVLTACVDQGYISFQRNGSRLGAGHRAPSNGQFRPHIAMRREAEIEILPADSVDLADLFASPADIRNMAWNARLNKKGNTLVMFQAFFLSLVRRTEEVNWGGLAQEYDQRYGFPAPEMSSRLFDQFVEVHRIVSMDGSEGWSHFFRMLGFGEVSTDTIDRMLFKAFTRAKELNYKMGGRHDHA